ncbi:MAG: ABC transporter ATP-binding protein [Bacteroidales bacterium]|nr:ABC transporter ATP-binding protein [Candidatus Scybalousia scybalohippi]
MVRIENLDFSYKKNKPILKEITLNFAKGRIHGLLGKNGVGKTTLMHLIAGLQFPVNGTIMVEENIPSKRNVNFLQDLFFLNEDMPETEFTIDKFEKYNSVFYPSFSHSDFVDYLTEFEISDTKQKISKLSFGTRKKVYIAFGLACNAKLTLLDEPTNGLDIPSKSSFRKIMQKAMTDEKCVIISTHQARDLQNLLDNIVILDETSLMLDATTEEITEKLWFGIEEKVSTERILYQEDTIAGLATVRENHGGEESNLDVELLFNAAFSNRKLFNELFNNK